MTVIPDFATHYYPAEDRPFQNLSDLSGQDLAAVIESLARRGRSDPGFHRVFGPKYMAMRAKTEAKMHDLFRAAGGKPRRKAPHYFVLGTSRWFEGLYGQTKAVQVPLSYFPTEVTSITYPDSFAAMGFGEEFGLPPEPIHPAHKSVFRLEDLADLIQEHGMPQDSPQEDYEGYHLRPFEKYVEIQLWSDEPVADFLE